MDGWMDPSDGVTDGRVGWLDGWIRCMDVIDPMDGMIGWMDPIRFD